MSDLKICVYAIAKNEQRFAHRWAMSMSEADEIIVLDTGSTDHTVEILKEYPKVRVFCKKIEPWRFDDARNACLKLIPEDVDLCVSTDLDEVFTPGWRTAVEQAAKNGINRLRYRYVWSYTPDGKEDTVFYADKMHARNGFYWVNPVHEVLSPLKGTVEKTAFCPGLTLEHHPDSGKSREQYLPLLELAVKEAPENDRNTHYLAREYYFYRRYKEAIKTFERHLSLKSAVWKEERCASYRYMARCYLALNDPKKAELCYLHALSESPDTREPWVEFGLYCYEKKDYHTAIALLERAIALPAEPVSYLSSKNARDERPYDVLSLCYYRTGDPQTARVMCQKAISINPADERLKSNLRYFT